MPKPPPNKAASSGVRQRVTFDPELYAALEKQVSGSRTLSDLVNDACRRVHLPGGMEASLEAIARALAAQAGRQRHLELRQQVQLETLAIFLRLWFTMNPELPAAERRAAGAVADGRLSKLLDAVAETVGRDTSILGRSAALNELIFGTPPGVSPAASTPAQEEKKDDDPNDSGGPATEPRNGHEPAARRDGDRAKAESTG